MEARRGPEQTETFTRTVRIGRNGTFDLSNVSGDIVVTGGGGEDIRIDATKRVRGNEADAKALLQAMQIQVSERSGLVEVRTELPRRRNWSGGVDFTVDAARRRERRRPHGIGRRSYLQRARRAPRGNGQR